MKQRNPLYIASLALPLFFGGIFFFASAAHATSFPIDTGGTLTTGLVAYYPLDNTSDTTSNGYTLTNNGSTAFNGGFIGNAADFGSSNSSKYLDSGSNMGIDGGAMSIAGWFNFTDTPGTFKLAEQASNASGIAYFLRVTNETNNVQFWRIKQAGGATITQAPATINTGTWYFLVGTYDGTYTRLYYNGTLIAGPDAASGASTGSYGNFFRVGHGDDAYFSGKADEVGIWSKALSAQEITDLYNNGCGDPYGQSFTCAPYIGNGSLQQYQSNGTTTISQGGTVTGNTVVFGAKLFTSSTSTAQFQVEVATSTSNFTGTPNASSSYVSPGIVATTSISGLASGGYYWRARAVDQGGATSTWQYFSTSSVDFVIPTSTPPSFQVDTNNTLTSGLQAYYQLNDTSDATGNNNTLANNGSSSFDTGFIGNGADFGSSNSSKYLAASTTLGVDGGAMSISGWFNFTDTPGTFKLAEQASNNSGIAYFLRVTNESTNVQFWRIKEAGGATITQAHATINTGTWYHLVGTYDGTYTRLYYNGTLIAGPDAASGASTGSYGNWFRIGHGDDAYFSGKADEVGVWNKALSQQEVTDLYNGGHGDPYDAPLEPVVIIPGIMGSKLDLASDGSEVWPDAQDMANSSSDDYLDALDLDSNGNKSSSSPIIYTGDIIRVATATLDTFPYTSYSAPFYGPLIEQLTNHGYAEGTNLFVAPYDWRFSEASSVSAIAPVIQDAIDASPNGKIDVIAHSMGGMVMKAYLQNATDTSFMDKLIVAGVPQLGAPLVFKLLNYGDNLGLNRSFLWWNWGLSPDEAKSISQNMPGVYDLLPSSRYIDVNGGYVENDMNGSSTILGYDDTNTFMTSSTDPRNSTLLSRSDIFHESIDDEQFNVASSSVYNILGCDVPTVGVFHVHDDEIDISPVTGDGTVPFTSATNLSTGYQTYLFATSTNEDNDHSGIVQSSSSLELMSDILADNFTSLPNSLATSSASCYDVDTNDDDFIVISTHSPVELNVYDEQGRHVGPNHESRGIDQEIPGSSYDAITHNDFAIVPAGKTYNVVVRATGIGKFNLDVEMYSKFQLKSRTQYLSIPISSTSTEADATITPDNSAPLLNVNANVEGIANASYEPTSVTNFKISPVVPTIPGLDLRFPNPASKSSPAQFIPSVAPSPTSTSSLSPSAISSSSSSETTSTTLESTSSFQGMSTSTIDTTATPVSMSAWRLIAV